MEIQVREVKALEAKGVQELEKELLEKHEEQINNVDPAPSLEPDPEPASQPIQAELQEQDVLSYISKRYNKQINSFDDLVAERSDEQLPADVSAYLNYRKETGRGFEDFIKLKEDFDAMAPDNVLRSSIKAT